MSEVYYYLSAYNDEVCPHLPTLESAAWFLHFGSMGPEDTGVHSGVVDDLPLAQPGDIVRLDALVMLADRKARRDWYNVLGEAPRPVWTIAPPIPPKADFIALRFAQGQSWDVDTISDPRGQRDLRDWLDTFADDEDELEHIALGVMIQVRAVFYLEDETPKLVLLEPAPTAEAFADRLAGNNPTTVITDDLTAETTGVAWRGFIEHLAHQREWSKATFGPDARLAGVLDHIRKELKEIEADPNDLKEWVDVIILAFDGAWRAGWEPADIVQAIRDKQAKNEARTWPDWRTADPDKAIEHDRSKDNPEGTAA